MSLILKTYFELIQNIQFLIEANINILIQDMENSDSFDPKDDYYKKNQYFNRANQIGMRFLRKEFSSIAEIYYEKLLEEILNYESKTSKNFNKGIVYANLGVAQMSSNKFDEGIANLLKAHEEDKDYIKKNHGFILFNTPLYKQFENKFITIMYRNLNPYANQKGIIISKNDLEVFLSSFNVENRLFMTTIIREIDQNWNILKEKENIFTRILLFSNLKNLCLFVENYLKNILKKRQKIPPKKDLKNYITVIFKGETWWAKLEQKWTLTNSGDIKEFEQNLKYISKNSNDEVKRLLYLGCLRNFSGHHFDVSSFFLFTNFEEIYRNILWIIYWMYSKEAIK